MKIITLATIGALAFAAPAFAQMAPGSPGDSAHGGARGPQGSHGIGDQRGAMDRGHSDGAMSGGAAGMDHGQMGGDRGRGIEHAGHDRGMDHGNSDYRRGNGRNCRTVWHHHQRVRRCD